MTLEDYSDGQPLKNIFYFCLIKSLGVPKHSLDDFGLRVTMKKGLKNVSSSNIIVNHSIKGKIGAAMNEAPGATQHRQFLKKALKYEFQCP
jgi:hypothetical protein